MRKAPCIYQTEVDRNYEAFEKLPADYCCYYHGMHALMKDRKVIELFYDGEDAYRAGKLLYKDQPFSIQQIGAEPIYLGFWSHVILQMPNWAKQPSPTAANRHSASCRAS